MICWHWANISVQFVKMAVVECLVLRDVDCGPDSSMLCIRVEPQAMSDCRIRHQMFLHQKFTENKKYGYSKKFLLRKNYFYLAGSLVGHSFNLVIFSEITDGHSVLAVSDCDYALGCNVNGQQSIFSFIF